MGSITPDAGVIHKVDGQLVRMEKPARCDRPRWVSVMVHQHLQGRSTVSTVLENVVLGSEAACCSPRGLWPRAPSWRWLPRDYGLKVDPAVLVAELSVGDSSGSILRAVHGARIRSRRAVSCADAGLTSCTRPRYASRRGDDQITHKLRRSRPHQLQLAPGRMVASSARPPRPIPRVAGRADGRPKGPAAASTRRHPHPARSVQGRQPTTGAACAGSTTSI